MKAHFVSENIDFERGGNPLERLDIGKKAHPIKIFNMEEEMTYDIRKILLDEFTKHCSWCIQEAENLTITPRGQND